MQTYKSKIGIGFIVFLSPLLGGLSLFMFFLKNWLGLVILIFVILFIIYIFKNTYYQIHENQLIIKSGFIVNLKIVIQTITKIKPSNSFESAPATSLDRLELFYNQYESVLVSPLKKEKFIEHLTKINPNIQV